MPLNAWRAALTACSLIAAILLALLALQVFHEFTPGAIGTLDTRLGARDVDDFRAIVRLGAESPLAQAGASVGDKVRLDHPGDRLRRLRTGEPVGLTLRSAAGIRHVVVQAVADVPSDPLSSALNNVLTVLIAAIALGTGVLIGWRQREPGPLRVLALVNLAGSVILTQFAAPEGWILDQISLPIRPILYWVVFAGFAYFCMAYPTGACWWSRPSSRRVFHAFAVLFGLCAVAGSLLPYTRAVGAWTSVAVAQLSLLFQFVALGLAGVGWWVSRRRTRGSARERVAWIGLSIGSVLVASTFQIVLPALGLPLSALQIELVQGFMMLGGIGGLGYAVLRGRVLDSGFAVNRAMVYSLFGAMLLVTAWLAAAATDAVLMVEARGPLFAVLLAGLLVALWSPYRGLAERTVLALLYPRWRNVEAALSDALQQAGPLRGRETLLAHYLRALKAYTGGAAIALYERGDAALHRVAGDWSEAPSGIATDASTLTVLQAGRLPALWPAQLAENALVAGIVHRDMLTSVLVVAGRPDFQAYRPDEVKLVRRAVDLLGNDLRADAQRERQSMLELTSAAERAARIAAERLRDAQSEMVRRFATPEVATDLEQRGFALGGRRLRATTLFCDIRGFTGITEHATPEETIELLNGYYACMFEAIGRHGGAVNQIVGDGLMAIFGAPMPLTDAPGGALRAARDMLQLLDEYNRARAQRAAAPLLVGIGIASGEVVAGYTGTEQRATYTCVGDTVNLAARLEAMTKEVKHAVLLDAATRDATVDAFAFVPLGVKSVRGRQGHVEVFALVTT